MNIYLDIIGFVISGLGAIFFFFIYAFILEESPLLDLNSTLLNYGVTIKRCWMKSISGKTDLIMKTKKDTQVYDKTDWTKKKRFAVWAIDEGTIWSFGFIALGFILQLISKFI